MGKGGMKRREEKRKGKERKRKGKKRDELMYCTNTLYSTIKSQKPKAKRVIQVRKYELCIQSVHILFISHRFFIFIFLFSYCKDQIVSVEKNKYH